LFLRTGDALTAEEFAQYSERASIIMRDMS